jgi:K+ transporter
LSEAEFAVVCAGGWFPIALSLVVFFISAIWFYGRQRKGQYVKANSQYLEQVLSLGPPSL